MDALSAKQVKACAFGMMWATLTLASFPFSFSFSFFSGFSYSTPVTTHWLLNAFRTWFFTSSSTDGNEAGGQPADKALSIDDALVPKPEKWCSWTKMLCLQDHTKADIFMRMRLCCIMIASHWDYSYTTQSVKPEPTNLAGPIPNIADLGKPWEARQNGVSFLTAQKQGFFTCTTFGVLNLCKDEDLRLVWKKREKIWGLIQPPPGGWNKYNNLVRLRNDIFNHGKYAQHEIEPTTFRSLALMLPIKNFIVASFF